MDAIGPDACTLLQGMPQVRGVYRFRQSNDFYYCCGVEIPHAYLLIDGRDRATRLFVPAFLSEGEGDENALTLEDTDLIKEFMGIDEVLPLGKLMDHLKMSRYSTSPTAQLRAGPRRGTRRSAQIGSGLSTRGMGRYRANRGS